MSATSKPRNVPGTSGMAPRRLRLADDDAGVEAAEDGLEQRTGDVVARHDDDVVVGGVERIERRVELVGIEQRVASSTAAAGRNEVRAAGRDARDDVLELRLALQQLVDARRAACVPMRSAMPCPSGLQSTSMTSAPASAIALTSSIASAAGVDLSVARS